MMSNNQNVSGESRRVLTIEALCLKHRKRGSVAEWSKALVLGTSLFGGVGSNPTAAKKVLFKIHQSKKFQFTITAKLKKYSMKICTSILLG